jgi:hypothetical protein
MLFTPIGSAIWPLSHVVYKVGLPRVILVMCVIVLALAGGVSAVNGKVSCCLIDMGACE